MKIVDQLQRIGCVSEFDGRKVSDADLDAIVEAAAWAPSAANAQPWEIVAVRDQERKVGLVRTLLDSHLRPRLGGDGVFPESSDPGGRKGQRQNGSAS